MSDVLTREQLEADFAKCGESFPAYMTYGDYIVPLLCTALALHDELDAAKRERDALHQYPLAAKYDRDAGWKYSPHFLQRIVQMSETIEPDGESLSLEQVEQVLSALDALRAKESQ